MLMQTIPRPNVAHTEARHRLTRRAADTLHAPPTEVLGWDVAVRRVACLACGRVRLTPLPLGGLSLTRRTHKGKVMITNSIVQKLRLGFTWCYLLKYPNGYLLVDTSYPEYFAQFQKSFAKLGIDISGIKYLLLTHHHDNHAGFAAELVKKTGCRVIVHHNAVAPLKQGESEDTPMSYPVKGSNLKIRTSNCPMILTPGTGNTDPTRL